MLNISHGAKVLSRMLSGRSSKLNWRLLDSSILSDASSDGGAEALDFEPPIKGEDLEHVLSKYGINGTFKDYRIGSTVTTYEVEVPIGTKMGSIIRYRDDLARDLRAPSLRIIKSIHSSSLVGFEVENSERFSVSFSDLFKSIPKDLKLPVILGEDTYGSPLYTDLASMPHMLVAGRTGSGKSVFLNTLITTLISKLTPEQVQFMIVDPKQVEFTMFEDIPHLFNHEGEKLGIAEDVEDAKELLEIAVEEMGRRFELFREGRVKKIEDYNKISEEKLPYLVFIVDEFSDFMLMSKGEDKKIVENNIVRIAQKARAVGIHMVLATQKPLAQVMTTLIKANMPARVAFSVASAVDSRVILDDSGAESLVGKGDMLFMDPNARSEYTRLVRVQAPYIPDEDIDKIISYSMGSN